MTAALPPSPGTATYRPSTTSAASDDPYHVHGTHHDPHTVPQAHPTHKATAKAPPMPPPTPPSPATEQLQGAADRNLGQHTPAHPAHYPTPPPPPRSHPRRTSPARAQRPTRPHPP
jgi:hypothetical protein